MSFCQREDGKDDVIFVTKVDHQQPTSVVLKDDEDDTPGLILSNGDINWECPCLGGMATGPCGNQFREAFSCFHFSEAEPKGTECFEAFRTMQDCMSSYPELYGDDDDKESDEEKKKAVESALAQLDEDTFTPDTNTSSADKTSESSPQSLTEDTSSSKKIDDSNINEIATIKEIGSANKDSKTSK